MPVASRARLTLLALCLAACAACAATGDPSAVGRAVAAEYKHPAGVAVRNGRALVVTFENAPFAGLPAEPRAQLAREVARLARAHYADAAALDTVAVAFEAVRGGGPVTAREQTGRYAFAAAELAGPGVPVTVERP